MPAHKPTGVLSIRYLRTTSGFTAFALLAAVAALPGGAQERPVAQSTIFVLGETRPAIELPGSLPTLTDFLSKANTPQYEQQRMDWEASWEVGPSRGRGLRTVIYEGLDPNSLAVEPAGLDLAMGLLRTSLAAIEAVEEDLPLHLSLSFREAQGLLSEAQSAAATGQGSGTALLALKAADALRELTPKAVALALMETAEAALAAEVLPQGVTEENAARARRLVLWARNAARSEDHTRAVERAYYACKLAGVLLP